MGGGEAGGRRERERMENASGPDPGPSYALVTPAVVGGLVVIVVAAAVVVVLSSSRNSNSCSSSLSVCLTTLHVNKPHSYYELLPRISNDQ